MRIINKKAYHKYQILEKFEAGLVLSGGEVKSIRAGRVDLSDSFAKIQSSEVYLKNAYIYPYSGINPREYDPRSDRKLLLHRGEINSLVGKLSGSASTLVPLSVYTSHNFIKVEVGVGVPKKKYDHKKAIKERDEKRRLEQEIRAEKLSHNKKAPG